jgi:mRNA interferase RelE/StbE
MEGTWNIMYKIKFLEKAIKDLRKIDIVNKQVIKEKILLLASNPEVLKNNIKILQSTHEKLFRLRVGRYRVVFQILDKEVLILIVRIGHRKNIYDKL